jgi:hypothetical protein
MSKEPGDGVLEDSLGNGDVPDDADPATSEKRGTEFDTRDMNRMGKLPQLRVRLLFALRRCALTEAFTSGTFASHQSLDTR